MPQRTATPGGNPAQGSAASKGSRRDRCRALAAWRRDLAAGGARKTHLYDWLWRASCWEAAALDAEGAGAHHHARHCRALAREIVARAAAEMRP